MSEGALKKYNEVVGSMLGNPSSLHRAGFLAEREIECAREAIRKSIRAEGAEVIFTASGSEANNLAILGHALSKERYMRSHAKIIITEGEHASVREPAMHLKSLGFEVIEIPTKNGKIDTVSLIADPIRLTQTADIIGHAVFFAAVLLVIAVALIPKCHCFQSIQ